MRRARRRLQRLSLAYKRRAARVAAHGRHRDPAPRAARPSGCPCPIRSRWCSRAAARSAPIRPACRGAGGQGDRDRLGRRHLDRRDQRRDHRRQSARAARSTKLRGFWEQRHLRAARFPDRCGGDEWREWMHMLSAGFVAMQGVPGFFTPARLAAGAGAAEERRRAELLRQRAARRDARRASSTGIC